MQKTNQTNLPSPSELAGEREKTRNFSLRIKVSTINTFEKWADEYDTSVNSLISNLLDAYIESQKGNK